MLASILLLGCQSERSHKNSQNPVLVKSNKKFKKEHHLFLNYYFGMTIQEYETATKENFVNRKVFLSGEQEDCQLNRYNHKHTQEDIENISRHSTVYYEFSFGSEEFEAVLKPSFKYDRLVKVELQTLHCYNFGNHNQEFYRRKVNDTKKALLDSHAKEFGKYKIAYKKMTEDDMAVIRNAGVTIKHFDTNKYIFSHSQKIITIEQKCCDFKPLVIYTHAPYAEIQQAPNSPEKLEREINLFTSVGAIEGS